MGLPYCCGETQQCIIYAPFSIEYPRRRQSKPWYCALPCISLLRRRGGKEQAALNEMCNCLAIPSAKFHSSCVVLNGDLPPGRFWKNDNAPVDVPIGGFRVSITLRTRTWLLSNHQVASFHLKNNDWLLVVFGSCWKCSQYCNTTSH